jgi:hypothetical protein
MREGNITGKETTQGMTFPFKKLFSNITLKIKRNGNKES